MSSAGRQGGDRVAGGCTGLGVVGREASVVVDAVAELVDGFDPELTGARDALDLVAVFSRLEHLASAGVALAARRVAQTNLWRRGGHRSAAHWLASVTGMGVADAVRLLQTAETVEAAPETRDALRSGEVSVRQAKAIGAVEAVDPDAGQRLLAAVPDRSAKELEDESARIVRAASRESETERALRHRKARRVFHGVNADGMGYGGWLLPIAEHTKVVAAIEGERARVFRDVRSAAGGREPVEAHAADALCRIVDRVTHPATEIDKVVHLGRRPTVLQRTALEWFSAGECSIEGCTNPARIEIDHVHDWADTEITALPELATPCGHHHDLKTHHGYTFGPRLPSGKRRLLPPAAAGPPDSTTPHPSPGRAMNGMNPSQQQTLLDTG